MRLLASFVLLLSFRTFSQSSIISPHRAPFKQRPIEETTLNCSPAWEHEDLEKVISSSPLLTFHKSIVEIESITKNEAAVADWISSYLTTHNFTVTAQEVAPTELSASSKRKRRNVIAVPSPLKYGTDEADDTASVSPNSTLRVLISSHIDTVPPFLPYKLIAPESSSCRSSESLNRSAIKLWGRGSVDDKACVAAQIHAVLDLLSTKSIAPTSVALLFVVGEEHSGDGMHTFSESDANKDAPFHTVIFGEPTEGKLAAGHKGSMWAKLTAKGKAAHSGYPWLGKSANSMLIPALVVLDKLGDIPEEDGGLPRSEKYGKSTVNVGVIRGGVAANVVPEQAVAEVTFRLAGGTRDKAAEIVKRALEKAGVDEDVKVEYSQGYGPVDLDTDIKGFGSLTVNYGTDVPNLEVRKGVKRYLYGPGSIQVAHSDHEALTVGELEQAVEDYKTLILESLKRE